MLTGTTVTISLPHTLHNVAGFKLFQFLPARFKPTLPQRQENNSKEIWDRCKYVPVSCLTT